MQISAESRWFTSNNTAGQSLRDWFFDSAIHGQSPGAGAHRQDDYLCNPSQAEMGIKRRGTQSGVEIKGLVYVDRTHLRCGPLIANVEIWAKWTSAAMDLSGFETITIRKSRWVRMFDTSKAEPIEIELLDQDPQRMSPSLPVHGCSVEFTEIEAFGRIWFTFGLEAFGQLENVDASLRRAAKILALRNPPEVPDLVAASYPQWISNAVSRR
jgi:hypothetical protein